MIDLQEKRVSHSKVKKEKCRFFAKYEICFKLLTGKNQNKSYWCTYIF